jgi:predicted MFS family arabinose efflux permease
MGMMFFGGAIATTIGGGLAFIGSWKLVYAVYGLLELILALLAIVYLGKVKDTGTRIPIFRLYKNALSNRSLRLTLFNLFLMGYCILGTFVYTGKLVENKTGLNVFMIGIILSLFGIGSILAGRKSVSIRLKLGKIYFLVAGLVGCISVLALVGFSSVWIISFSMLLFGAVFIALQSSFVSSAQSILPNMRGTVMALASFSVVIGGSLGTYINGRLLNSAGLNHVFIITAMLLFSIGLLATILPTQMKTIQ